MNRQVWLLMLLLPALAGWGGPLVEQTRSGNRALEEGKVDEALKHYAEAQLIDHHGVVLVDDRQHAETDHTFEGLFGVEVLVAIAQHVARPSKGAAQVGHHLKELHSVVEAQLRPHVSATRNRSGVVARVL